MRGQSRQKSLMFAVFLLAVLAAVTFKRNKMEETLDSLRKGETFVEVDGRKVHVRASGDQEKPVVVLVNDLGGTASDFAWVQDELAADYRVIAYDRLGTGLSDDLNENLEAESGAKELKKVLDALRVLRPAFLVGYGFGAQHVRLFHRLYPDEVRGLLLIEPSHPDEERRLPAAAVEESHAYYARITKAAYLANFGFANLVRFGQGAVSQLPKRADEESRTYQESAEHLFAVLYEIKSIPVVNESVRRHDSLGTIPLGVVSATLPEDAALSVTHALHAEIAGQSTRSFHQLISGARHESIVHDKKFARELKEALLRLRQLAVQ